MDWTAVGSAVGTLGAVGIGAVVAVKKMGLVDLLKSSKKCPDGECQHALTILVTTVDQLGHAVDKMSTKIDRVSEDVAFLKGRME